MVTISFVSPFPQPDVDRGIVSGHFVQIPDWGNLLLDAGEGTWGQMARYFGTDPARPSNVWLALRDLKCIFISHAHADHHSGLAKILAMRKKVLHHMPYPSLSALTGIRARPSAPGTSLPDLDTTDSPIPARTCRFGEPWVIRFDGHTKWRYTHPERCTEYQRAMSDRTDWVEPT